MKIKKIDLYKRVAENLNAKGIKPFSAREWNAPNIQNFIYKKMADPVVLAEIQKVTEEMKEEAKEIFSNLKNK